MKCFPTLRASAFCGPRPPGGSARPLRPPGQQPHPGPLRPAAAPPPPLARENAALTTTATWRHARAPETALKTPYAPEREDAGFSPLVGRSHFRWYAPKWRVEWVGVGSGVDFRMVWRLFSELTFNFLKFFFTTSAGFQEIFAMLWCTLAHTPQKKSLNLLTF